MLGELVAAAAERADSIGEIARFEAGEPDSKFERALRREHVSIIAEVKRQSPSRGSIRSDLDAGRQAREYAAGGAAAISVLTEPVRFGGRLSDLIEVKGATSLPTLRKDFIVAEAQLFEARAAGADAALLIVRALEPSRFRDLMATAHGIALEVLCEVRDERELAAALDAGARVIGVNNRNLESLEIDRTTVERIVPLVPPELVAVAESGYTARSEIERAAQAGANAILVGSFLSAAGDPAAALRELVGVRTVVREPAR